MSISPKYRSEMREHCTLRHQGCKTEDFALSHLQIYI